MLSGDQMPAATRILTASSDAIAAAAACLRAGGLVAFPTETVYGLGADAGNGEAIARLYAAKGRPTFNPLIAHVANTSAARRLADFDDAATRLAVAFWPGPLTLVLPKLPSCRVADLALAGLDSLAGRVPAHPVAHALLTAFGGPVVAPSANRSGHVSPTTAAHVLADLRGRIDLIVDAGPTPVGLESTIVACVGKPTLLRPGALPRSAIEQALVCGEAPLKAGLAAPDFADVDAAPVAPGQLPSHYAPRARLRLNAAHVNPGEALLAFGPRKLAGADAAVLALNLSPAGDLIEAAAALFSHLRALDACGAATIEVMPVPR